MPETYNSYIMTHKKLSKNVDLVIIKPDEGKVVVILDKATYLSKMGKVLSDKSSFVQFEESKRSNNIINQDKI